MRKRATKSRRESASWVDGRPKNRKARRTFWAMNKKRTKYTWLDSMQSIPDLFPLLVGKHPDGSKIYMRADEIVREVQKAK